MKRAKEDVVLQEYGNPEAEIGKQIHCRSVATDGGEVRM
jgi:hypothetical protein